MINLISAIILLFLLIGRRPQFARSRPILHSRWMMTVISGDVALIAYLTFSRDALSKVNPSMSVLLMIHVFFALSTVVLYGLAVYYGVGLLRGDESYRVKMIWVDKIVTPLRTAVLATSLFLN